MRKNKTYIFAALALFAAAALLALYITMHDASETAPPENSQQQFVLSSMLRQSASSSEGFSAYIGEKAERGELKEMRNARYAALFKDSAVIGDSIASGLSGYGFLPKDKVFCEVGGSVMKNDEEVVAAARAEPKSVFFSFGMNDLGMYSGNTSQFIDQYTYLIEEFKALSPKTEIYVNSISKPSDSKISSGGYFHKWEEYNDAIEDMCREIGAEYIDNTSILYDNPNLYAGDGIHVASAYYPIWIERMIKAAAL